MYVRYGLNMETIHSSKLDFTKEIQVVWSCSLYTMFLTTKATICTKNVIAKPFSNHHWHREVGMMKLRGTHVRTTCQRMAKRQYKTHLWSTTQSSTHNHLSRCLWILTIQICTVVIANSCLINPYFRFDDWLTPGLASTLANSIALFLCPLNEGPGSDAGTFCLQLG